MKNRKNKDIKPYLVAITGNFGSGKSLVGEILKQYGYLVVDTDEIVREILKTKNSITERIVDRFGFEVKNDNDEYFINKRNLASIVFGDETKRKELEAIVHPSVEQTLAKIFSLNKDESVIFVMVPLLFECSLEKNYHEVWCIKCDDSIRLLRLMEKGFSEDDIKKRLNSQMSQDLKENLSDFAINNSGTVENTKSQINKILNNRFN